MLSALRALGLADLDRFGDSTGPFDLRGGGPGLERNL
jgi:hypothetical protein